MAVEARHLNLFPPQLISNRDLMNPNQGNAFGYNNQMGSSAPAVPLLGSVPENLLSHYQSLLCDSLQAKTSINTESGLTYNIPAPRKRSRDQFYAASNFPTAQKTLQFPSFVGDEILPQFQQHQLEIDAIIAQHTKKIRLELEEKQKQHARLLMAAIGEGVIKKLKEKDEQIQRMGKLNQVLQERVKSLYVENQLWRDLAQTNEATVNSLRTNLEQVLAAHVGDDQRISGGVVAVDEEVESCCGSTNYGGNQEEEVAQDKGRDSGRMCRRCGEKESSVLLLPCRHLCLCASCGSGTALLQTCPVCNSNMNATLHVNMSS